MPVKQTKTDTEPVDIGVEINLDKDIRGGNQTVREALSNEIWETLDDEIKNQQPLVDKIHKWQKMFRGDRPPKSFPFSEAANVAIPLTRWLIETVFVRIIDAIFSQQKLWVVKAKKEGWRDIAPQIEEALEWWQKHIAKLRKNIMSPLLQGMKMGTGITLLDYERQKRVVTRHATEDEKTNKNIQKYKTKGGNLVVKVPITQYEGPVFKGISREDLIISSDSNNIQDAWMVGYRSYIKPSQLRARLNSGFYTATKEEEEAIKRGTDLDTLKIARIEEGHRDVQYPVKNSIEIFTLWVKFDVDDDGEVDDVKVTYNRDSKTILRAVYNPFFYGYRPLQDFVFDPIEFSFDGIGGCEKLEHLQEEIDTLHNQRLDRANQLNGPVYLRRIGSRAQEHEEVYPGLIIDTENIHDDMKELAFHDVYPDTVRLESLVNNYAMLVMGVSPQNMGQQTSERPVAKDTYALIQEVNKKFKSYIDNIRDDISELGMRVIEMISQYQPKYSYMKDVMNEGTPEFQEAELEIPADIIRDGIMVELSASSEVLNSEVKREIDLALYQLINDYNTKLAGMIQFLTDPKIAPELKKFMYDVAEKGAVLIKRIVRDFGSSEADSLVSVIGDSVKLENIQKIPYMPDLGGENGGESQRPRQGQAPGAPPQVRR